MSLENLQAVTTRLVRSGDNEAAGIINKLIDDLARCEMASEQFETKAALAEKARDEAESRCEFLITELEAAIARAKQPEPKQ